MLLKLDSTTLQVYDSLVRQRNKQAELERRELQKTILESLKTPKKNTPENNSALQRLLLSLSGSENKKKLKKFLSDDRAKGSKKKFRKKHKRSKKHKK